MYSVRRADACTAHAPKRCAHATLQDRARAASRRRQWHPDMFAAVAVRVWGPVSRPHPEYGGKLTHCVAVGSCWLTLANRCEGVSYAVALSPIGTWKNITLRDIYITNPATSPGVIIGNESNPMTDIVFDNVSVVRLLMHALETLFFTC